MPKTIWPNATYYSIMKIPDKRDIQQIALNHSSDIEFSNISTKKKKKKSNFEIQIIPQLTRKPQVQSLSTWIILKSSSNTLF